MIITFVSVEAATEQELASFPAPAGIGNVAESCISDLKTASHKVDEQLIIGDNCGGRIAGVCSRPQSTAVFSGESAYNDKLDLDDMSPVFTDNLDPSVSNFPPGWLKDMSKQTNMETCMDGRPPGFLGVTK
ncbi:hypothetical protein Y1Q_0014695 [Alligator mississippiensis]|uniref:Uncharacterized protein n=1 Tax=Alligator mississippiensis TaxID=8496 RepID=A0A151P8L4_ALLMI|nr:hypothetical protein Y1Q_0014695 [Alligator mississippiensis]